MSTSSPHEISPGLLILHGNRAERLAETVAAWLACRPLAPLEEEVVLVQSNGMAEWLKMTLAQQMRVCAATRVELPGRFQWRTYRQILGRQHVPSVSPFDKRPLTWRLLQLLPTLLDQPGFEPLAGFMTGDEPERLLQLAQQLADLLDQYQVYRADWLQDWAQGLDVLRNAHGEPCDVPPDQRWQPLLWRALVAPLDESQQAVLRPRLHQRVLQALQQAEPATGGADSVPWQRQLPRRVVLFGMTHVPLPLLELLVALGRHSQVLMAVPNPCRFHWADIMDGRELLRLRVAAERRRLPLRAGRDLSALDLDAMHAHAHPLLAAWGRQGRDFVRQLDAFDNAQQTLNLWGAAAELPRVDLFDDEEPVANPSLLAQVQARVRDLVPLNEHAALLTPLADEDDSIIFHTTHGALREVEVLHDQLLDRLARPAVPGQAALAPRDIVVMVPDVALFEPAIRAVFGQYRRHDPRYIPFDIADLTARHASPVLVALEWLLHLPRHRCTFSELRDLLDVPAVARRFGLVEEDLPRLTRWMEDSGLRWGLDGQQRSSLGLSACGDINSQHWAVQRMLLGFASGGEPVAGQGGVGLQSPVFQGLEPFADLGGLEAELVGSLAHLHERLLFWWQLLSQPASPATWAERGRALLADFFKASDESDRATLAALDEALSRWLDDWALSADVHEAGLASTVDPELPLAVARQAWLDALDEPQLNRRFRAGGVTFCTLMPMRAIPFEMVCLLGMNEGDYPRRAPRSDFDLLAQPDQARPGDRSRRDDDRQLMLEALLSARRTLYVSWTGRSVRDNTEQPPSVLVSQLRDYLKAGWGKEVLTPRTFEHPLQPFSRRYFEPGSVLFTHAREWRQAHELPLAEVPALPLPHATGTAAAVSLDRLAAFLRNPVKAFFRDRLSVVFDDEVADAPDEELFALTGLDDYALMGPLLAKLERASVDDHISAQSLPEVALAAVQTLRRSGRLPLGAWGQLTEKELTRDLAAVLGAWRRVSWEHPEPVDHLALQFEADGVWLLDGMDGLRSGDPEPVWMKLSAVRLLDGGDPDKPRLHALLPIWLRSLASAACGRSVQVIWVGRDATCVARPLDGEASAAVLKDLLAAWQAGQIEPLPVALKTALAWLQTGDGLSAYEGGYMVSAERQEPCLARQFPDYVALRADGRFEHWAGRLYQPLLTWASTQVTMIPHAYEGSVS